MKRVKNEENDAFSWNNDSFFQEKRTSDSPVCCSVILFVQKAADDWTKVIWSCVEVERSKLESQAKKRNMW